jgi:Uma2 family endonuclease
MAEAQWKSMTVAEFLAWEPRQEEKWELVDGAPRLRRLRLMAGGTYNHGFISMNIGAALKPRLRGGPCAPLTSDVRVVSPTGNTRYPDITVDCGPRGFQLTADAPRAIFEVTSPSNNFRDQIRLLEDYQAIEAVQHIVFVAQTELSALVWTREGAGWRRDEVEGGDGVIALPALELTLPMAEIYDGVTFEAAG